MLYRGMDRAQLDAAYNNSAAVPERDAIVADWAARSAKVRREYAGHLDLAYGATPRERLDLFLTAQPKAPTLAFIHGGYWQMNDKENFAFFAEGLLPLGINLAVIELYPLRHLFHKRPKECATMTTIWDPIKVGKTEGIAMFDLETNKAIALRLIEVFNGRRLDLLEDVLHPEFRGRGISAFAPDGPEVGPGARRKLYEMFLQAIPDARGEVLDLVAEGDKVVLVDRFGGTHRGEFFGRPGTGDRIEWMAIHIYTIRDGKVLEDAVMTDALAIAQQLGLAPSLTKAAE